MNKKGQISIQHLGQTGLKIDLLDFTALVDPYLSNSVELLDSPDLIRQVPIIYEPKKLTRIDLVLITHDHMDHCDPHTIPIIAEVNPSCNFIGPRAVREKLIEWGIDKNRILPLPLTDLDLGHGLFVRSIISAHPSVRRDPDGLPQAVGFIFSFHNRVLYAPGDTSVCDELIGVLKSLPTIDIALLPVNEDNYFRRRRGIVGNMSIREAFELAREVGIKTVVPVHWDMFQCNSVTIGEILSVYNSYDWSFDLGNVNSIEL